MPVATAAISGTISDESRAPVPNIRVCAEGWDNKTPRALTRAPHCSRTNAVGEYTIAELVPSRYFVSAMGKPFLPGAYRLDDSSPAKRLELAAGEKRGHIDITLKHGGGQITGTVSDINGGAVPRAQIRVEGSDSGVATVECDDVGKFDLWIGNDVVLVAAYADGYATGYERGIAPGIFNIELTPGAAIAGTVVNAATNQPIAGVRVDVSTREWIDRDSPPGDVTDDDGHYTIERLQPDRYSVLVREPKLVGSSEGSFVVGIGQQVSGIVVRTFPAVRIDGHVVVRGSRATPCEEPSIEIMQHRYSQSLDHGAGSNGAVYADGALPGTYEVTASCRGFVSLEHYEPIHVANSDIKDLTWEVIPGGTIRGRVVDRSGTPIARVSVFGYGAGSTDSDADGRYELHGVGGGEHTLLIRSDKWTAPPNGWLVKLPPRGDMEQNLTLDATGSIRGTVVDNAGEPISGASISVEPPFPWKVDHWMNSHASGAFTGSDGTFELLGLPTAEYTVTATRGEDNLAQKASVIATRASSVKFVLATANQQIHGNVTDTSGSPIADAYVIATREVVGVPPAYFNDDNAVVTRPDGAFAISHLTSGLYRVKAFRKGGGEGFAEHVAAGGVANITLAQTGTIEGSVRIDGTLAHELYIDARDTATGTLRSEHFFGTSGHYSIRDLAAGRYIVSAHVNNRMAQASTVLAAGERKNVDIDFDRGVSVTGRVLDLATGLPVARVKVTASLGDEDYRPDLDEPRLLGASTDDAGRFRVEHVSAGRVVINAYGDGSYSGSALIVEVSSHDVDIGDVGIVKQRVGRNDPIGELGIKWVAYPDDMPSNQRAFEIAAIAPNSPAAAADLHVGDVVLSVDGIDALGGNRSSAWTLMTAPPGTSLKLGLSRGSVVTVVLGKP